MVRELTELQGTMGGIYAREEGLPEEIWKAIYFHYLPVGVEADAPPSRQQLGSAALTWAAVSLADKLDSVVGMFGAGERPTGSRDPLGPPSAGPGNADPGLLADLPAADGSWKGADGAGPPRGCCRTLAAVAMESLRRFEAGATGVRHANVSRICSNSVDSMSAPFARFSCSV